MRKTIEILTSKPKQDLYHSKKLILYSVQCNVCFFQKTGAVAVWRFKPILIVGFRVHSYLYGGLRLRNYCAVAWNYIFCSRFSDFFLWWLFKHLERFLCSVVISPLDFKTICLLVTQVNGVRNNLFRNNLVFLRRHDYWS